MTALQAAMTVEYILKRDVGGALPLWAKATGLTAKFHNQSLARRLFSSATTAARPISRLHLCGPFILLVIVSIVCSTFQSPVEATTEKRADIQPSCTAHASVQPRFDVPSIIECH